MRILETYMIKLFATLDAVKVTYHFREFDKTYEILECCLRVTQAWEKCSESSEIPSSLR